MFKLKYIVSKTPRYFHYFDVISFTTAIMLGCLGLLFVYSATYTDEVTYSIFFKKQALGLVTGVIIYLLFSSIDYRILCQWGSIAYIAVVGLLIFTLIKGKIGMGAQRWINFIFFRFQPSEMVKLFFPAFIIQYLFSTNDALVYRFKDFFLLLIILFVSTILILKQPDLGTGLLIFLAGFMVLWLAGLPRKFIFLFSFICILSAPIAWHLLKPYQKKRIEVFLGAGNVHKERYQIEQSKIAIGSGGFFGKGFLRGTQNRLMFLPEGRTDFIFAVICEEWGFFGALIIMLLYVILLGRLLFIIYTITNFFAQLLACGLLIPIALSIFINMGMVTGLLPIVGIPLPLLSYGITNLWITYASLGWINGIGVRRYYVGE